MNGPKTKRRRLEKLSRAAEAAVLKREAFGRFKLARWLKILKELARYDEAGDLLRARTRKWAIISGVALVPLVILLILEGGELPWAAAVLGSTILLAAGALAYCLIRRRKLKALDLANDFRTVLVPFLNAIREDVPSKDKIKLKIDLSGPSDAKVILKGEPAHRGDKQIQTTVYSDRWCHLEAPLTTGARITLDIANTYTRYDFSWKNSRGKSKRKFKWKKLVVAHARMSPDAQRFLFDPVAVEKTSGKGDFRLKKLPGGESAAIKAKLKFKSTGPAPPSDSIQPREILGMFLRMESLMRPVSTGSQNP